MKRTPRSFALAAALCAIAPPGLASALDASASNWSTAGARVVCGIAARVYGTHFDPGAEAELDGLWPGLQCSAQGIPRPPGSVGDPVVQLGQGRAGRAKLVDVSQDDLASSAPSVTLAPGSVWKRDGITCKVQSSAVRCANTAGRGFTISPGHAHLF